MSFHYLDLQIIVVAEILNFLNLYSKSRYPDVVVPRKLNSNLLAWNFEIIRSM